MLIICIKCILLPPGVNPIAVKYIISYHLIRLTSPDIKDSRVPYF